MSIADAMPKNSQGKPRPVVIVSLTAQGQVLAERISTVMPGATPLHRPKPFADIVQQHFKQGAALIMICASGIVVRTLASVLVDKHNDPPVLVLDEEGRYVIPLLSGHEGGGNHWARWVADTLQAHWVVTTAASYSENEKKRYAVGMGCERGCAQEELFALYQQGLQQAGLTADEVACIASIDIKADEIGLQALATSLKLPFFTYSAAQLHTMDLLLSTRSEYVFKTVGVYGVAESAALFAARSLATTQSDEYKLVLPKIKNRKATCAIAQCCVD